MPRAVEDETDDADCEVGVVYLDVVVAAGSEYLRGLGFECDQQLLHLGPDLLQPCGQLSGAVANGSVLLITASGTRGIGFACWIALIAPLTLRVSNPGW